MLQKVIVRRNLVRKHLGHIPKQRELAETVLQARIRHAEGLPDREMREWPAETLLLAIEAVLGRQAAKRNRQRACDEPEASVHLD